MSLVDPQSQPIVRSNLDLFSTASTDTSTLDSKWIQIRTSSNLTDYGAILEFTINGSSSYLDLMESYFYFRVKAKKAAEANLVADDNVYPCNNFMHSLIQQADIYLNNTLISTSSLSYAYRAYIEMLLGYNSGYATSQGPNFMYTFDGHPGTNNHATKAERKLKFTAGKEVELIGRLSSDIFQQPRYLLSGVDLRIVLHLNPASFVFNEPVAVGENAAQTNANYKFVEAVFYVRKQDIPPSISNAHEKLLLSGHLAKYPLNHVELKRFAIAVGSNDFSFSNVFQGQVPQRVIAALVSSSAVNGNVLENPFLFGSYGLNKIGVTIDGDETPFQNLDLNFTANMPRTLRAFYHLLAGMGVANDNDINYDINRYNFTTGYALYCFDIVQGTNDGVAFPFLRTGNVRIEGRFSAATDIALNLILYSEWPTVIRINHARQVLFDYTT